MTVDNDIELPSVVITGVGLVLSSGLCASEVWESVRSGASGFGPFRRFDVSGYPHQAAAEVVPYDLTLRHPKNEKFMSPAVRFALRAAQEAFAQSGLSRDALDPWRFAIHVGSGQTGLEGTEFFRAMELTEASDEASLWRDLGGRPSRFIDPYFGLRTLSNAGIGLLSLEFGARGTSSNLVQGDTASAHAIAAGFHDLRAGRCDLALVGGYDSLLSTSTFLTFNAAGLLSERPPAQAYRPFDRARNGLVLGEGAAFLILEREADARRRGAGFQIRVSGIGASTDLSDSLDPDGAGVAFRAAVGGAWTDDRSRLGFIVARGLGTQRADSAEAQMLFREIGNGIPVTSLKGNTGYLGAATAAAEVVIAALALARGAIPPVTGLSTPDEEYNLDFTIGQPRDLPTEQAAALCTSWSLTGQVAAIALERGAPDISLP